MVPVYLALVASASARSAMGSDRRVLLFGTALFVAGFAAVFTLLGMAASTVGATLAAHRSELMLVGGLLVSLLGLKLLGVLRLRWLDRTLSLPAFETRFWALNALLLGIVFALGWTPCVGPILGSVLTFTATRTASSLEGALYLFTYSLGVGLPLLVVAMVGDRALRAVRQLRSHLPKLERLTGSLMLLGGLVLAVPAVSALSHGAHPAPAGAAAELAALHPELADQPLLLAFSSPDCPVCKRVAPRIEALRHDCLGKRVGIVNIDVSRSDGEALAMAYGISGVPTVLLVDVQRSVEGRLVGDLSLSDLRAGAAALVRATCAAEPPRAPAGYASSAGCAAPPASDGAGPTKTCSG
jgi:cytochrome c-type biogenesis protein